MLEPSTAAALVGAVGLLEEEGDLQSTESISTKLPPPHPALR